LKLQPAPQPTVKPAIQAEDVGALKYRAAELSSRLEMMQAQLSKVTPVMPGERPNRTAISCTAVSLTDDLLEFLSMD
jgi:hypothetical protein